MPAHAPAIPAALCALLLSTLVSGCLASGEPSPFAFAGSAAASAPDPAGAMEFLPEVTVAGPLATGEPGIAVDPAGRIYVVAPTDVTETWRSDDGGLTFLPMARSLGTSGDGDIAFDADGTAYVSDLTPNVTVSVSFDQVGSYAYAAEATRLGGFHDRQWMAATGSGTLYVTWHEALAGYMVSISHDAGRTWAVQDRLIVPDIALGGPVVLGPGGSLYAAVTFEHSVGLVRSVDGGATWAQTEVARMPDRSPNNIFPASAVDAKGNVYVLWSETGEAAPAVEEGLVDSGLRLGARVMLARSLDGGATFGEPVQLSEPGHLAVFPWLVAGDKGRVAALWLDGVSPLPASTGDANLAAGTAWSVKVAVSLDADGASPSFEVSLVTPEPVHTGSVCVNSCRIGPVGVGAGRSIVPSAYFDRRLLDYFEAGLDNDGNLLVTWAEDSSFSDTALGPFASEVMVKFAKQGGGPRLLKHG